MSPAISESRGSIKERRIGIKKSLEPFDVSEDDEDEISNIQTFSRGMKTINLVEKHEKKVRKSLLNFEPLG
jgi:hypothetical protein